MKTISSYGKKAWVISNKTVEMTVTCLGGHMAPVTFDLNSKPFEPYYISPWQGEKVPVPCPVLAPLRGDFFCLPFGGNQTPYQGECHPPHGETSGSHWKLEGCGTRGETTTLSMSLAPAVRPGRIVRHLSLAEGHSTIYSNVIIEGFVGATTFAHHAILAVPEKERSLLISTSHFDLGMTFPSVFGDPHRGEYQALKRNSEFDSLDRVSSVFSDEPIANCSSFPVRYGYCDLIQQFEKAARNAVRESMTPSWVTAVNVVDHWLWFAFKSPTLMPGRVFWMENHGRHGKPWNGRNSCLGIEDGCMYFDYGVHESSRSNSISKRGFHTHVNLSGSPFEVRYIQGAIRVPAQFKRVENTEFQSDRVKFTDVCGRSVSTPIHIKFLSGNEF